MDAAPLLARLPSTEGTQEENAAAVDSSLIGLLLNEIPTAGPTRQYKSKKLEVILIILITLDNSWLKKCIGIGNKRIQRNLKITVFLLMLLICNYYLLFLLGHPWKSHKCFRYPRSGFNFKERTKEKG